MHSVLVVDDDPVARKAVRGVLEQGGYSVHAEADGDAALRFFRETPTDVVVTDIMMPRMGGLALAVSLRQLSPTTKIIAITSDRDALGDALRLGVNRVLTKPFTPAALNGAVRDLLETCD